MKRVGGQALPNGIMMIGSRAVILVKKDDGNFEERIKEFERVNLKIPILRGILSLVKQLRLGFEAMYFSSKHSKKHSSLYFVLLIFATMLIYPYALDYIGLSSIQNYTDTCLLVVFFLLLSRSKSTDTMLKYHGAEHKVLACHESELELTTENAKQFPKEHPRCGTSLGIVVVVINIIFSIVILFIDKILEISELSILSQLANVITLILGFGIAYELILLVQKKQQSIAYNLIIKPGLFLQKFTTKEPDNEHLELAINALKKATE